jgi:hypothetical protein
MANKTFSEGRALQPAFTLSGNDLIAVESAGNTRFPTIDELSTLLTGNTVINNITDTYRVVVATPASLPSNNVEIATGILTWGSVENDPYGVWSGVAASRLYVPAGYTKARLTTNLIISSVIKPLLKLSITKNGSATPIAEEEFAEQKGSSFLQSRVIPVVAGDYFEVETVCFNTSSTVGTAQSYFQIEFLEMIE